MAQFPTAIPSYAGFTSSHTLSADNHAAQSNAEQGDISAIATKVGTGSSTPVNQRLLRGNGTGTSAWAQVDLTTDVTGVLPSANLPVTTILAQAYPVGSIYINATDSTNPGTLLGFGTWTQAGRGRVLVGEGTSDQAFTIGTTGGESNHALTTAELASHTHTVTDPGHTHGPGNVFNTSNGAATGIENMLRLNNVSNQNMSIASAATGITNQNTGSGTAHNNLQPYLTVYMWQRTA